MTSRHAYPAKMEKDWTRTLPYTVDPDGKAEFTTINAAVEAASELPAGHPIVVELAAGKTHTLVGSAITMPSGRNIYIRSAQTDVRGVGARDGTILSGSITMPTNDALRKFLALEGFKMSGNVNLNSRSGLKLNNIFFSGVINRTHGTWGCDVEGSNVTTDIDSGFRIVDADAGASFTGGVYFKESDLASQVFPMFGYKGDVSTIFENVNFTAWPASSTQYLLDFNSAYCAATFYNCNMNAVLVSASLTIAKLPTNGVIQYYNLNVSVGGSGTLNLSNSSTIPSNASNVTVLSTIAPASPPSGAVWKSVNAKRSATYVYHASYPFWNWSSWELGEAFVDGAVGDATASTGSFATIVQAINALDAFLASGSEMVLHLADGNYSAAVTTGTDHPIKIKGTTYRGAVISGSITFSVKGTSKIKAELENVELSGNQEIKDGRDILYRHCYLNCLLNLDASTDSLGWELKVIDSEWWNARVVESATSTAGRSLLVIGTRIYIDTLSNIPFNVYKTALKFYNVAGSVSADTNPVFKCNSDSPEILFDNFAVSYSISNGATLFDTAGSAALRCANAVLTQSSTGQVAAFGSTCPTPAYGAFTVESDLSPTNQPTRTIWRDSALSEILTWDGTYWSVAGTRKRKDIQIPLDTGAASAFDVGWDVPGTAYVVAVKLKILKTITGASGATKLGLGLLADPDKWTLTADLNANTTAGRISPTWATGAGDDLLLSACDDDGAAAGTIAGSGADDVKLVTYFELYGALP